MQPSNNVNRITITNKGRALQNEIFQETLFEPRVYPIVKSSSQKTLFEPISPNDEAYSARSGYFRSKEQVHTSLKAPSSTRLYPNYMRQDPREYPPRHECSWTPRSTVQSSYRHTTLYPISKQVHHSLFQQPPREATRNPTLRELNTVIKGDHGHLTLDLTSCKYPRSELRIRDSTKGIITAPSSHRNPEGFLSTFKEAQSIASSPRDSHKNADTMQLDAVLAGIETPNLMASARSISLGHSRTFRKHRTTASLSNYKVVLKKTTDEKVQQIFGRHHEKEKAFMQTLSHLNNKMKEKMDQEQDVPHHAEEFHKKLKSGGAVIDQVSVGVNNEFERQKKRLNDFMNSKYEKSWKRWEKLYEKPKPIQNILRFSRESKTFNQAQDEDSIVSREPKNPLILGDLISNLADKLKNEL